MSRPSQVIEQLARRLIAAEPARQESSNGNTEDRSMRVCARLQGPLTRLAGAAGFSSLMSRALALAARQDASLERLRVDASGSLMRSDAAQHRNAAEPAATGEMVLVTELLELLVTLIGEPLTLSLVREAWPEASLTPPPNTEEHP